VTHGVFRILTGIDAGGLRVQVGRIVTGVNGLLSTPAVSSLIRRRGAYGARAHWAGCHFGLSVISMQVVLS
jgi:phosphoglucomutase